LALKEEGDLAGGNIEKNKKARRVEVNTQSRQVKTRGWKQTVLLPRVRLGGKVSTKRAKPKGPTIFCGKHWGAEPPRDVVTNGGGVPMGGPGGNKGESPKLSTHEGGTNELLALPYKVKGQNIHYPRTEFA